MAGDEGAAQPTAMPARKYREALSAVTAGKLVTVHHDLGQQAVVQFIDADMLETVDPFDVLSLTHGPGWVEATFRYSYDDLVAVIIG